MKRPAWARLVRGGISCGIWTVAPMFRLALLAGSGGESGRARARVAGALRHYVWLPRSAVAYAVRATMRAMAPIRKASAKRMRRWMKRIRQLQ